MYNGWPWYGQGTDNDALSESPCMGNISKSLACHRFSHIWFKNHIKCLWRRWEWAGQKIQLLQAFQGLSVKKHSEAIMVSTWHFYLTKMSLSSRWPCVASFSMPCVLWGLVLPLPLHDSDHRTTGLLDIMNQKVQPTTWPQTNHKPESS